MPLFIELASGELLRPSEVMREMGDVAIRLVLLTHADGRAFLAADCREWLECDCPDGSTGLACEHLLALSRAGIFPSTNLQPRGGRG